MGISAVGCAERKEAPFGFSQDRHRSRLMRVKPHIRVPPPADGSAVEIGCPADLSYLSASY